jgi:hypothetical protein
MYEPLQGGNMRNKPRPQEIYRHYKGKTYQIVSLAEHSETGEELVVYQALYEDYKIFARPLSMFMDEIGQMEHRFVLVEKDEKKERNEKERNELSAAEMKISAAEEAEPEAESEKAEPEAESGKNEPEAEPEKNESEAGLDEVDPLVLEFLGAGSYDGRLQVLTVLHPRITDGMINTMAVSLDLEIADGPIEKRYDELRHCLLTMKKFEINR